MKKTLLFALSLAIAPAAISLTIAAPAVAQTTAEQRRWDDAQARYRAEFENYLRERDRFMDSRRRGVRGGYYDDRGYQGSSDDGRFATDYDATRYYRDGPQYRERVLTDNDEVYRGSDGRYYCRRGDGTTGLIIGGVGGALFGNVIDGGRSRTAGTLVGGALGALLGREVDRNRDEVRCR